MNQTLKSLFPYYEKIDITVESLRIYTFPNGDSVTIQDPQYIIVSDNGHRIRDALGVCHYVPYGWIHLRWWSNEDTGFYCEGAEAEKPYNPIP